MGRQVNLFPTFDNNLASPVPQGPEKAMHSSEEQSLLACLLASIGVSFVRLVGKNEKEEEVVHHESELLRGDIRTPHAWRSCLWGLWSV